jgi:hypothetical protein
MKKSKTGSTSDSVRKTRPALTPEARENQLMSLAVDLIEQRLRDGTASSQETTAILKMTMSKARIEREILEEQKKLVVAKTDSLKATQRIEELYSKALNAMRRYSGQEVEEEEEIIDEY